VRPSFDFPELGVAAALWMQGRTVERLALAAGGLESYPRLFPEITARVAGRELDDAAIAAVATEVHRGVRPVHNTFLDPSYRRRMVPVYVRRVLRAVRDRGTARGGPT